jgi:TRAP transporter TAXI family solute receptor
MANKGSRLIVGFVVSIFFVLSFARGSWGTEIIPIVTPGAGGGAYIVGTGVATIMKKHIPGIETIVQAESGVTTMLKLIHDYYQKNQPAFTLCDGNGVWSAYSGAGLFKGKERYSELRGVNFIFGAEVYFVTRKGSGIKSFPDAKGKRISVGPPGSSLAATGSLLFSLSGLSERDYNPVYLSYNEVVDGIKDNVIDGGILAGSSPVASYVELSLTHDVTIIPVSADVMKSITEKYLYYYPVTVKKGTYKGLDADVPTIAFGTILTTHERTDSNLVYKIVKTLYDHRDELISIHKAAQQMTLESAFYAMGIPLHEGAKRYFKEIGRIK